MFPQIALKQKRLLQDQTEKEKMEDEEKLSVQRVVNKHFLRGEYKEGTIITNTQKQKLQKKKSSRCFKKMKNKRLKANLQKPVIKGIGGRVRRNSGEVMPPKQTIKNRHLKSCLILGLNTDEQWINDNVATKQYSRTKHTLLADKQDLNVLGS